MIIFQFYFFIQEIVIILVYFAIFEVTLAWSTVVGLLLIGIQPQRERISELLSYNIRFITN